MEAVHNPRVAIISDSSLQRLALAHAVKGHGYELALNIPPERLDEKPCATRAQMFGWWTCRKRMTIFLISYCRRIRPYCLASNRRRFRERAYPRWERRVFIKLHDVIGHPVISESLDRWKR
jgi:chemosensory pili system protein ChpB (putative protein-glutamate methylesterase)